jgi:hypothetical protein
MAADYAIILTLSSFASFNIVRLSIGQEPRSFVISISPMVMPFFRGTRPCVGKMGFFVGKMAELLRTLSKN